MQEIIEKVKIFLIVACICTIGYLLYLLVKEKLQVPQGEYTSGSSIGIPNKEIRRHSKSIKTSF